MARPARGLGMLMTVDQFLVHDAPEDVKKMELVRGELHLTPPPASAHGGAIYNLVWLLMSHVRPNRLGSVFGDGVGYELVQLPRTVRMPDASFVRADRLPPSLGRGLFKFAPDIAIEVLSPSETSKEVAEKIDDYLSCGTQLMWVVDPRRRTVRIVSTNSAEPLLHEGDTLTGGHVLPGFSCGIEEIFDGIARDLS